MCQNRFSSWIAISVDWRILVLIPGIISSPYKCEKSSLVLYASSDSAFVTLPNFFDCSTRDTTCFESCNLSSVISKPVIYFDFTSITQWIFRNPLFCHFCSSLACVCNLDASWIYYNDDVLSWFWIYPKVLIVYSFPDCIIRWCFCFGLQIRFYVPLFVWMTIPNTNGHITVSPWNSQDIRIYLLSFCGSWNWVLHLIVPLHQRGVWFLLFLQRICCIFSNCVSCNVKNISDLKLIW